MSGDAGDERRWWIAAGPTLTEGRWRVLIQFADGRAIEPVFEPGDRLDHAIRAAAEAYLAGDRRWTPKSERGG